MASKIAYPHAESFDDSTPAIAPVRVCIKNLRQVGEDLFDIEGMTLEPIDGDALREVLNRHNLPNGVIDDIADLIFRHDVAEWLAQGIIRK